MTLAVLDIDGVVADVRHRLHHLDPPRSWDAFFHAAAKDTLLPQGARLAAELAGEHDIVWLSGRPEWLREVTTHWLAGNGLPGTELHLRGNRDRRPARVFKLSELDRLATRDIAAFVDDDEEVVRAAVRAGYPAVIADWVRRTGELRAAQDSLGRT